MLSQIGLVLIIVAWILQGRTLTKKKKSLNKQFIVVYMIGIVFLILDGFKNDYLMLGILNLVVLAITAWVYIKAQ
jgi:hypothetical protein